MPQRTVFGPKYKPPMSRNAEISQAMQAGYARANRRVRSKCPQCGKTRVCEVFGNGVLYCSEKCMHAWVYRNSGGKPP